MSWTVPKTWIAGEPVSADVMNRAIRDQFAELQARVDALEPDVAYVKCEYCGGVHEVGARCSGCGAPTTSVALALAGAAAAAVDLKTPFSRRSLLTLGRRS